MRACVHIYSMMSMHEEAVALALQVGFNSDNFLCILCVILPFVFAILDIG